MTLLINICKEKLHELDFVKPIEDILKKNKIKYFKRHYRNIKDGDLKNARRIIICGTSLKDNEFVKDVNYFEWIYNFNGKILGICGGMQIIGLMFNGKLKQKKEIGYFYEEFKKEFLGLQGKQEVFHLHNHYIDFNNLRDFETFSKNNICQAVKHKDKEIYGVLFQPEVRNKELILNFINNP